MAFHGPSYGLSRECAMKVRKYFLFITDPMQWKLVDDFVLSFISDTYEAVRFHLLYHTTNTLFYRIGYIIITLSFELTVLSLIMAGNAWWHLSVIIATD